MAVPAPAIMASFQQAGKGAGTGHPASSKGMTWRFRDNSRSSPFGATKSTSILKHKEAGTSRLRSGQFCDKGEKWLLRIREHYGPEWSSDEEQTEQGPLRGAWRREAALGIALPALLTEGLQWPRHFGRHGFPRGRRHFSDPPRSHTMKKQEC